MPHYHFISRSADQASKTRATRKVNRDAVILRTGFADDLPVVRQLPDNHHRQGFLGFWVTAAPTRQ